MGEPIRILHMIGSLNIGGSQAMVINLYKNIDRSKIQFDFILDHPLETYYKDTVLSLGARVYEMPTFTGKNYFQVRKAWARFFLDHPEYKILHSHVRSYASIYIPIAKRCGLKTIIHSHSTSNGAGISSIVKRIMQFPLRYQADYLIACSTQAGCWLFGEKACQKSNYLFLPNAINVDMYRYSENESQACRGKLGLTGKFVVGHVGRFHRSKNHAFLLDVFAEICKHRSDAMLLLIGDGELRGEISEKIKVLELQDRVILAGNCNNVPELLQVMDVFAFPSAWEGLPVTVIEAQAAGLRCFISDNITKDVDVSELVVRLPINDPCVWADNILRVTTERVDVSQNIRAAGFDVSDTAMRLVNFYCSIGENNG